MGSKNRQLRIKDASFTNLLIEKKDYSIAAFFLILNT
jgi:hypothetical protein